VNRERAVNAPRVMQVGECGTDLAHDAQHMRNVLDTGAAEARADGLARNPPAEIPWTPGAVSRLRPIMVGRGYRGVVAMRERPRLCLEPRRVRCIWRGDEGERAPQSVDHFLKVAMLLPQSLRSPIPGRRKNPLGEMLRQGKRYP